MVVVFKISFLDSLLFLGLFGDYQWSWNGEINICDIWIFLGFEVDFGERGIKVIFQRFGFKFGWSCIIKGCIFCMLF